MSAIESLAEATEFYVNSPEHFAPLPRPSQPANIITSDAEAIAVAERLAQQFAPGAARRDRDGILPVAELDAFSQSGLWGINIPREYGGAGVSYATVAKVIAIISAADSALGQIPQNHLAGVAHLLEDGTESQKQTLLAGVLSGLRWGNAFSEKGTATVAAATVATAEAKVLSTEIAILAGNKLFELAGTRSTLAEYQLDRPWRNARTHTLHDPVRWKYFHVGNYYLNGVNPPRHAWS